MEMTIAYPAALPGFEVVPVRFTPDDSFYDDPQTWDLPDCAVALWSRAGSWSARNRKDGFVPAPMLARFCGDPVQAAGELCGRGLWRRVKGGYQFTDWEQNGPTAEQAEREEAAAAAVLAGKSDGGKLGNHRRWHASRGVTMPGCEYCQAPEVAGETPGTKRSSDIRSVSDRYPTPRSRSDDFDQSSQVSHPAERNARAGEDPPPLVAAVAAVAAEKAGRIVSDDEARTAIAEIRRRAARARRPIHDPLKYIPAAVENEPDVFLLLLGDPESSTGIFAEPRGSANWCGKCRQDTRMRERDDGTPYRCPECGPRARSA